MAAPSTPSLSVELKALIEQRNVLTSRTKSKVIRDLNKQIQADQDKKEAELKAKAVDEIFTSEVSYLNQLEIAMKYFKRPIIESNLKLPDSLKSMFDHLESLYKVNGELLNELRANNDNVAAAFITVAPFFKLYSVYAYDYRHALSTLQELPKTNPKLDSFLQKQETRPEVNMKLGSLMIAPIQRVPRYRLLLKELLSHTHESNPQHKYIIDAIKSVESATEHINTLVYEQENVQRIIELQKSLCGGRPTLVHPGRKLIKEGILMKVTRKGKKAQQRYFILMNDVIMYCKMTGVSLGEPNSLRCSCVLPLRKCYVQHVFSDKVFTITCNTLTLVLFSDEPYCSENWVKSITEVIQQEQQDRQTLNRRGSARQPLRKKDINLMTESLTPRKRKQQKDDIDDICLPFHSPWKRNKISSSTLLHTEPAGEPQRRVSYFSSIKKAFSNFGQSIQKYWVPIYTGRENNRRLTN